MRSSIMAAAVLLIASLAPAASPPPATQPGDRMLAAFFRDQAASIASRTLDDIQTLDQWNARRDEYRRQLAEMLGLWPQPPRGDLKATITGRVDHPQFTVEDLHFQSIPGLYVTANLYIPKNLSARAPTVLYVCGHGNVKKDNVSYGAKTFYQHHGAWFARNGYVCLILDTLQLGEIEGLHHGTYRENRWDWHSRGYTPAGVEAWNGIRALDYLSTRPEVDMQRIGITGRSGGGAYSWWIAALDERIKVAVPVAGITDLQNHIPDNCIDGHCDCMFMVNTRRWDFSLVAALVAPRPLLIANTDKDSIFPLDGVGRVHAAVRRIYRLHRAEDKLGLIITEGPHKDTQELQVPAFHWFNRHLKNDEAPIELLATRFFEPEALKVFKQLPADQLNTRIHDVFVPNAPAPAVPASAADWQRQRDTWMSALRESCFSGWPAEIPAPRLRPAFSAERAGLRLRAFDLDTQTHAAARLYLLDHPSAARPRAIRLNVLDAAAHDALLTALRTRFPNAQPLGAASPAAGSAPADPLAADAPDQVIAWIAPRGVGPSAWTTADKRDAQVRRRFALLGLTLDAARVWDIRCAVQALRALNLPENAPLTLHGRQQAAALALYAALFEPTVARLDLVDLPASHRNGPHFLSVLRILDLPAALALAAERTRIHMANANPADWTYPVQTAERLRWPTLEFTPATPAAQ